MLAFAYVEKNIEDLFNAEMTIEDPANEKFRIVLNGNSFKEIFKTPIQKQGLTKEYDVSNKRSFTNICFELIQHYAEKNGKSEILKKQEWYAYFYILRVLSSHYLKDKELDSIKKFQSKGIPIKWRNKEITEVNANDIIGNNVTEIILLFDDIMKFIEKEF